MADILNIDDYRPQEFGPVLITFFASTFQDERNNHIHLSASFTLLDGDAEGAIAAFRENGGMFVPPNNGHDAWFLPWPCAVRIRPLTQEEIAALPRSE